MCHNTATVQEKGPSLLPTKGFIVSAVEQKTKNEEKKAYMLIT